MDADRLSKAWINMEWGTWKFTETKETKSMSSIIGHSWICHQDKAVCRHFCRTTLNSDNFLVSNRISVYSHRKSKRYLQFFSGRKLPMGETVAQDSFWLSLVSFVAYMYKKMKCIIYDVILCCNFAISKNNTYFRM